MRDDRGAFRAVRAALANELKVVCDQLGVGVCEALGACGEPTLAPTPGGCDAELFLLAWGARRGNAPTRLLDAAAEINSAMPAYVVAKVGDALNDAGKAVRGSKVAILGMAQKKDGNDSEEAPSFELLDLLLKKGARVSYNDPHVPSLPRLDPLDSTALTAEYLAGQDCVLIATDHTEYDYAFIVAHSRLVVDTRNATRAVTSGREKVVRA